MRETENSGGRTFPTRTCWQRMRCLAGRGVSEPPERGRAVTGLRHAWGPCQLGKQKRQHQAVLTTEHPTCPFPSRPSLLSPLSALTLSPQIENKPIRAWRSPRATSVGQWCTTRDCEQWPAGLGTERCPVRELGTKGRRPVGCACRGHTLTPTPVPGHLGGTSTVLGRLNLF